MYLKTRLNSYVSTKRTEHLINCGESAYKLAKQNNENAKNAKIAAVYHDIAKEMPDNYLIDVMKRKFPQHLNEHIKTFHAFVGSYMVKKYLYINDSEIINAIKYHTTATSQKMTKLDQIVYIADKISAERNGENVEYYRNIASYDLLKCFKIILKNQYEFLKLKNLDNNSETKKAFLFWCNKEK